MYKSPVKKRRHLNFGVPKIQIKNFSAKDGTCKFTKANVGATIDSCFNVKQGDEAELENFVATVGPVSVAMDAHLPSFRFEFKIFFKKVRFL